MSNGLFLSLSYADAPAAMEFLSKAFGFVEKARYSADDDPSKIVHAQMDWPNGGGLMFGSAGADSTLVGTARCYCVTQTDEDVDRIYQQALVAGATSVRSPENPAYGGRVCAVADPEGNQFSFGSFPGD
jgi:uncharacterized glyoxalase superfamily protein PhnB